MSDESHKDSSEKQIPLTEQDALVVFDVKEGQRQQEVADAQLAHLRDVRREVQDQVLGQMINGEHQRSGFDKTSVQRHHVINQWCN